MKWTLDTRIELADPGYRPTQKGRRAVQTLLAARDTLLTASTDRQGYPLDFEGYPEDMPDLLPDPTAEEKGRFYRNDAEARNFSDGRGDY